MVENLTGVIRQHKVQSMPEQFLRDIPEEVHSLTPDTRAIVHALYEFERRAREREEFHNTKTSQQIEDLRTAVSGLAAGFPGGDPDSHRRYHESVIEWRELRNRMVRDSLIQASKAGGFAAIGWIAYALWSAFRMEIIK